MESAEIKILISDPLAPEGVALFDDEPQFQAVVNTGLSPEELESIIPEFAGLLVRSATKATRSLIEKADNLKVIGRAGMGLDNIDQEAARERDIEVLNTPGASSVAVAELVMGLMLALCREIPTADGTMKAGAWEKKRFKGIELKDKVLGLVGLGRIGREVARRAKGFDMTVIASDLYLTDEDIRAFEVEPVELDHLLSQTDFISIHAPMTEKTKGMIDAEALAKVKEGVRIINCARGGILDEGAVLEALNSGRVAGLGMDVYPQEPPQDWKLAQHEKVIATPHVGASTAEAQLGVSLDIVRQVIEFFKG
jgi:D-3-phosphoglycerate dehydrogenase